MDPVEAFSSSERVAADVERLPEHMLDVAAGLDAVHFGGAGLASHLEEGGRQFVGVQQVDR